jgi:hypothetical protein
MTPETDNGPDVFAYHGSEQARASNRDAARQLGSGRLVLLGSGAATVVRHTERPVPIVHRPPDTNGG